MELFELFANKQQKAAIMSRSDIMIGFEFEMYLNPRYVVDYKRVGDYYQTYQRVIGDIGIIFNERVVMGNPEKTSDGSMWSVVPDGSLTSDPENGSMPIEIISKAYPIGKAFDVMKLMFKWMKMAGHTTNDDTGLHVNVSIAGIDNDDIDFMKLMAFFDERHMLQVFDRTENTNAADIKKRFTTVYSELTADAALQDRRSLDKITDKFKSYGSLFRSAMGKYSSVNVRPNGVAEIRGFGNAGYEDKYDAIVKKTVDFANALAIAADPHAMQKEYVLKFMGLLKGKHASPVVRDVRGLLDEYFPQIRNMVLSDQFLTHMFTQIYHIVTNMKSGKASFNPSKIYSAIENFVDVIAPNHQYTGLNPQIEKSLVRFGNEFIGINLQPMLKDAIKKG